MKPSLVLLVLAGVPAAGAEFDEIEGDVHSSDLRLSVSLPDQHLQGRYQVQSGGGTARSQDVEWPQTGRIAVTWLPWPGRASEVGSGLWAFEVASQRNTLDADSLRERLDQRLLLLGTHLGMAWVPASGWTIETTGYFGFGSAWQSRAVGTGNAYELETV